MNDTVAVGMALDAPLPAMAPLEPELSVQLVQQMIQAQAAKQAEQFDQRVTALETRLVGKLGDALRTQETEHTLLIDRQIKPLQDALAAKMGESDVRRIVGEQIEPLRDEVGNLRRDLDRGLKSINETILSLTTAVGKLPERMAKLEGVVEMLGSVRSAEGEERRAQIARIEDAAIKGIGSVASQLNDIRPGLLNMQNDLYGTAGGAIGIVALTQQHHEQIIQFGTLSGQWADIIKEWREDREQSNKRLSSVEAFVSSAQAKQTYWAKVRADITAYMAKGLANRILVVMGGAAAVVLVGAVVGSNLEGAAQILSSLLTGR